MDIEVITTDANKNHTSEFYRNVTHVSVVGNWLYLTMATGEWAKLDSRNSTVEIKATDSPAKKWPAEWPQTNLKAERLRMELIRHAVEFMDYISDGSLPEFTAIERRKIIGLCYASEQELRDLALAYGMSADKAPVPHSVADLYKALEALAMFPAVDGMSAHIRDSARNKGTADPYAHAKEVLARYQP